MGVAILLAALACAGLYRVILQPPMLKPAA